VRSHRSAVKIGSKSGQYVSVLHGPLEPETISADASPSTSATTSFSVHVEEKRGCENTTLPVRPS
jgi:hypothetical protein